MKRIAWGRWLFVALVLAVAGAVVSHGRVWRLPDHHNPWAPLSFDERPGWLTRYKLGRLADDPPACLAFLATTPLRYDPLQDRQTGAQCGFTNAVRIRRSHVEVGPAFELSCRAAASMALWERHVLLPEAERLLGSPVRRLHHFGSYACRNVYGRAEGSRSRHATADALDFAGVTLASGRRITLSGHWAADAAEASPEARAASTYLHAVHAGACRFFDGVLGPEYNAAHADHLHLERGGYRMCR